MELLFNTTKNEPEGLDTGPTLIKINSGGVSEE